MKSGSSPDRAVGLGAKTGHNPANRIPAVGGQDTGSTGHEPLMAAAVKP